MWNMLNNGAPVVNNNGLSNSLINTLLSQGNGTWSNKGYSFDSDSHVSLGYNRSYRSLNTTLDKYIDIQEVVLKGRSFTWGTKFLHISMHIRKIGTQTLEIVIGWIWLALHNHIQIL